MVESGQDLIEATDAGLVCRASDFVIDPWKKTHTSLITHAHADHVHPVADRYFASKASHPLLRKRLGEDINIQGVDWGERLSFGDTLVSFHTVGHVLDSKQIQVEKDSEVWVFTGDFKCVANPNCEAIDR